MKKKNRTVETIDAVIRFIENNREQAISRLFPGANGDVHFGWKDKDFYSFWKCLDEDQHFKLMLMAMEHYDL